MIAPLAVTIAMLGGCASEKAQAESFTQGDLDKITENCGASTRTFVLKEPKTVHLQPNMEGNIEGFDCALTAIMNIPGLEIGFVGNEVYLTKEKGDLIKEGDEGY